MAIEKYKLGSGIPNWKGGLPYNITFIVTENCNLRCKYCYQVHKNNKKVMNFELAKKAVDYFLHNAELFSTDSVIWEFIGGEPLLEIDLIDKIADYIKVQTYERNHKWFSQYRFNISTNGTLYHHESVRKFIKKNQNKCSIGISIDGTKTKHDLQRVYANGKGSYDEVVKNVPLWLKEFPDASTKVTIGHEDLPYLKESIIHLWSLGITSVSANVVFEDVWEKDDEIIFENQLRDLADYILENKLWDKVECSLFDDKIGYPNDDSSLNKNHCGSGRMIAVDADGNFYPCLRYADYSLVNKNPYIIGNVNDGIDIDKIRPYFGLNTASQSDEECIDCEIALGCAWCQANNYDYSEIGTNYQRAKYICKMHKARCRANNYFWGRLQKEFNIEKHLHYGSPHKRHLYFILSEDSIEHCNYVSNLNSGNIMSENIIAKAFEFSEKNFFTPVILYPKNKNKVFDLDKFSKNERIEIVSANNKLSLKPPSHVIPVINNDSVYEELASYDNCILTVDESDILNLATQIEKLLKIMSRININLRISSKEFNFENYKEELQRLVKMLVDYYKEGQIKEINVITDRLFLDRMESCEFGNYNFAVSPEGKIYICPAFYFNDPHSYIGSLDEGININTHIFKLNNSPYCTRCDAYHCNRCIYLNKAFTNEFNIPSSLQCKISHLEREMSLLLLETLKAEKVDLQLANIPHLDYSDPVDIILGQMDLNPYNLENC